MLFGDVTAGQKKTAETINRMEIEMEEHIVLSPQYTAQSYVCLAYDWYEIGMEEEGRRLLTKAEMISPGYFRKTMQRHTIENPDYELLVNRLFVLIGWQLLDSLRDK